jgi:hypothetical protein
VGITWTAAQTGTVLVSNGSADFTLETLGAPQDGCSIDIEGDATFNELRSDPNRAGVFTLLHPFAGQSGVQPATCYGDSVPLQLTVDRVLGALLLHERQPLALVSTRDEWLRWQGCTYGHDFNRRLAEPPIVRRPGVPQAVWLETNLNPAGGEITYRARCAPMPNGDFRATLDVQTMPVEIGEADLAESATTFLPVPGRRTYGILRALALYHWSSSPWFRNDAARPGINTDYQNALRQLSDFTSNARTAVRSAVVY